MISKGEGILYFLFCHTAFPAMAGIGACACLRTTSNAKLHHVKDKWSCSATLRKCLRMISPGNELADIHPTLPGALGGGASPSHSQMHCLHLTRVRPPPPAAAKTDLLMIQTASAISPAEQRRASPKGQARWGLEHSGLAEVVPVHGRGVVLLNTIHFLILWF